MVFERVAEEYAEIVAMVLEAIIEERAQEITGLQYAISVIRKTIFFFDAYSNHWGE